MYVHNCFAVFQNNATQFFISKFNGISANFKFYIQVRSCQSFTESIVQTIVAFFDFFIRKFFQGKVNLVAAIEANHAVTVEQCFNDIFFSFKTCCVCTIAFFVAVFQNAPSSSVHCFKEVTFQGRTVFSGIVNKYGFQLTFCKKFCCESICCANPIAKANAGTFSTASAGGSPFYKTTNYCCVIRSERHNCNVYTIFSCSGFCNEHFAQLGFFFGSEGQAFASFGFYQGKPTTGNLAQRFIYDFACYLFNGSNC